MVKVGNYLLAKLGTGAAHLIGPQELFAAFINPDDQTVKLNRITNSSSSEAQKLIALHGQTFPEYERFQGTSLLAMLIDNVPAVHFQAISAGDDLAGFFMYWDLDGLYYIHFIAVFPEMRNKKIGQQVLDWVADNLSQPVFLESEVPYDEITARRLAFYERNGFQRLANNPDILAAVRRGGHPLWLMGTRPVKDLEGCLIKIRDTVYYGTGE